MRLLELLAHLAVHAGSPQAQKVVVQRLTDWGAKRKLAERIAGIEHPKG